MPSAVCCVQLCTVCSVQCAVCGCDVQCSECRVQCAVCYVWVQCAVCSVLCVVCRVQCAVCCVQCSECGVQSAVCSVLCVGAVRSVLCAVCSVLCAERGGLSSLAGGKWLGHRVGGAMARPTGVPLPQFSLHRHITDYHTEASKRCLLCPQESVGGTPSDHNESRGASAPGLALQRNTRS